MKTCSDMTRAVFSRSDHASPPLSKAEAYGALPARSTVIAYGDAQPYARTILPICYSVMPGLVPGIHAVPSMPNDVDGRDKPGHDDVEKDERKTANVKCDSPSAHSVHPLPLWERVARMSGAKCEPGEGSVSADEIAEAYPSPGFELRSKPPSPARGEGTASMPLAIAQQQSAPRS
ncbi:hypothetical protein SSBR45G_69970 [Bradyrhizobium sp. SSBR45G]|nr:hypothetical protein SSBR45G_69970 [Bradyrhizobium sp. SSBR45G]GLH89520.1 hypothetical protein SSBR45R_69810 [Bradyrhizobium sp. SSBR45R]